MAYGIYAEKRPGVVVWGVNGAAYMAVPLVVSGVGCSYKLPTSPPAPHVVLSLPGPFTSHQRRPGWGSKGGVGPTHTGFLWVSGGCVSPHGNDDANRLGRLDLEEVSANPSRIEALKRSMMK